MADADVRGDFSHASVSDPVPRDIERFREFLAHGAPGPHAYVALLGLDPFDAPDRRAARVFGRALALFEGDRHAASEWLTRPQPALGGAVPIALARSDFGAREVE